MRSLLSWLGVFAWAGLIFYGSSQPGTAAISRYSVVGHFLEYAVLGALIAAALAASANRKTGLLALACVAVLLASAYGASDEIHQAFVPTRVPDIADWGLDTIGALTGVVLVFGWVAVRRRRRRRSRSGRA